MTEPLCPFCREPAHGVRDCPACQTQRDTVEALLRARAALRWFRYCDIETKQKAEIDEILAWPKKEGR